MNPLAILEICRDCEHGAEWENGAVTCRLMKGRGGRPMRPCSFRAFVHEIGSRCPDGRWENMGVDRIRAPMPGMIGGQAVSIIPV